jgi:hypothetical protein
MLWPSPAVGRQFGGREGNCAQADQHVIGQDAVSDVRLTGHHGRPVSRPETERVRAYTGRPGELRTLQPLTSQVIESSITFGQ